MFATRILTAAAVLAALAGCGLLPDPGQGRGPASEQRISARNVQERWWNWAMSRPDGVDVVSDADGRWCATGQPDDVWFLAGTFGGPAVRECTVPAGRPLVFPLVNRLSDQEHCREFLTVASGSANVDGMELKAEALTGPVSVMGVADNAVTGDDRRVQFIACGLWAYVPPLAVGTHQITFSGQAQSFRTSVQYLLTVAA